MQQRRIGSTLTSAIGLGCMNLSHAYGIPPSREIAEKVVQASLDEGVTFFDTAALYGFGANETLMGELLAPHRQNIFLASKCGMTGVDGKRVIDGRPETLKATCEASLKRLRTDVIDLYYLHRFDRNVPIEDSVGALADLVREGKIRDIGLSEVSADTLRKAQAVHPIAAVQTEYSLWTRNAEIAVLQACAEFGTAFVAFSPVARGFLGGELRDVSTLEAKDIRRGMPRFSAENYARNLELLEPYLDIAEELDITPAQLALAWLLAQGDHILAIPGTTSPQHARDNALAADITLDPTVLTQLDELINQDTVAGPRYPAATQAEIDTEEF